MPNAATLLHTPVLALALLLAPAALAQATNDAVLQAHEVPAERRDAVEAWRGTLGEDTRSVWDERTGRLLLFGSLQKHADLLAVIDPPPAPAAGGNGAREALLLSRLTPDQLHRRIEALAKRPLPATWDAARTKLSFPASLDDRAAVEVKVDATTGQVDIAGPPESARAWREVITAMESSLAAAKDADGNESTIRIVSTAKTPRDRVRTALTAIQASAPGDAEEGATPGDATPDAPAAAAPGARLSEDESILGPVRIEFVEGLDVIVLQGDQGDVDRVMRIIDQIEQISAETTPEIKVRRLEHIDADSLARLLTSVYSQVLGPRVGDLSVTGLAKPNALLLVGREENVALALGLVEQLDQPVEPTNQFKAYPLEHASAADVKALVDQYFEQQNEEQGNDEGASLLRSRAFVVADYRSNVVIVSAAARDQAEVAALIGEVDKSRGIAVDEVRVFQLKNTTAEDLAEVIQSAIAPAESDGGDDTASPRAAALRLEGMGDGGALVESGVLTGVRISPDIRANALVVTAPRDSMALLAGLIRRLDVAPDAAAELKVFTIANGDAEALAEMLRSLFATEEDTDEPGGYGSRGLAPLSVSVDLRTNSIIAAGTAEDLAVVEAVLTRLDDAEVGTRRTNVFRLQNASAEDVANVLNQYLENEREAEADAQLAISPRELIEREVIVVAEPTTNSLIVSATPRYEADLRRLVQELDERPPMVMVQVLIAEVGLNDTDEFGVELGIQDSLLFDRSLLSNFETIETTVNEQSPGGATISTQTQTIINSDLTPGFNFNNQTLGSNGSTNALARAGNVAAQALSNFALGRVNSDLNFGGFVLSASSGNISALLRALQETRRLEVLSRPQIMMLDNEPGEIQVGARVPQITSVNQLDNGGQQNVVNYENVGIILQVTPRISPDGQVFMRVFAEKSEVGPEEEGIAISIAPTGEAIRAPQIETTTATTTITAASGQTIVLSGLLTKRTFDVHRRVPLLAEIPLVGDLFRYDGVDEARSELLIIMTPRVVRSELDAEMLKQVESSRMSWVLSDVIDLHGPAGLRTRGDYWEESEACYPTEVPTDLTFETAPGAPTQLEAAPATTAPAEAIPSGAPAIDDGFVPSPSFQQPPSVNSTSSVEAVTYVANQPAEPTPRRLPTPAR